MKHIPLRSWVITISLVFFAITGLTQSVYATVFWDSTMAPNVVDQNLMIDGQVQLNPGGTIIQSITTNIVVTLASTSVVRGNDSAQSQLYISAGAGTSITFLINVFDLTFQGSKDTAQDPLLIVVSGEGLVNFIVRGGRTVQFVSVPNVSGGTQLYVLMNNTVTTPLLQFSRDTFALLTQYPTVRIGQNSLMGFLSTTPVATATDYGEIRFDATNPNATTSTAEYVFDLLDSGLVLIGGRLTNQVNPFAITLANIDRTTAAGDEAVISVINNTGPTAQSSILFIDRNTQFPQLLYDPFGSQGAQLDPVDFKGSFTGIQYGFILGANGLLNIEDYAYFDFVGLANNICPDIPNDDCIIGSNIKLHNPSAFFIDGNRNPLSVPAQINLGIQSAIFFRSGIDGDGFVIDITQQYPFTMGCITDGAGEFVFDVEAPVNVFGSNTSTTFNSKLEILSLYVVPTGGALFLRQDEVIFPLRTFAQDCGLLQYNKAAFLVNSCLRFYNTALSHTDVNHSVCEGNDICSEPAYVGGESAALTCFFRPSIEFYNSAFLLNTSAAVTGVDLKVPVVSSNGICSSNLSQFTFFYNGYAVDNGTGRQLNLGTLVGSFACDGCTIVSADAHLDVTQTASCLTSTANITNMLLLDVAPNDTTIVPCIQEPILGQYQVNTIFLGQNSNISLGFNVTCTSNIVNPVLSTLKVFGNFFSFATSGGCTHTPSLGGITGQGIIFVDSFGQFMLDPSVRVSMGAMVVLNGSGIINIPEPQVYFAPEIGVTRWCVDLSQSQTLVPLGAAITDFTFNWRTAKKDYSVFCPYSIGSVNICNCPPVVPCNIAELPAVYGEVDQFQIQGSRIGDEANLLIGEGANIRELIFLVGDCPGEAPTAIITIQDGGQVGINTAHVNTNSLNAALKLGVNGVSFIVNGSGQVNLNEDVEIDNICSLLKGPDFRDGDIFFFNSEEPRLLRIRQTGILDLRQFGPGDVIQFCGQITVLLEPGARILLDGVTLLFSDYTQLRAETDFQSRLFFDSLPIGTIDNTLSPFTPTPAALPHNQYAPLIDHGIGIQNTDPFRIRLIGIGNLQFADASSFYIPRDTFVGVETLFEPIQLDMFTSTTCIIDVTSINIILNDSSRLLLGDDTTPGGTLQIGNTQDYLDHDVSFTLTIAGQDAQFVIKPEGLFGLGIGVVDKRPFEPSFNWLIDTLFNVSNIEIVSNNGLLSHASTFDSTSELSALIALADYNDGTPLYTFTSDPEETVAEARLSDSFIYGGGNMVIINEATGESDAGALMPVVLDFDDFIIVNSAGQVDPRMRNGLFSSRPMLSDQILTAVSPQTFFQFIKVKDYRTPGAALGKGTAAIKEVEVTQTRNPLEIGYVDRQRIGRQDLYDLDDSLGGSQRDRRQKAANIGSILIQLDLTQPAPAPLRFAQQLP